MMRRALLVTCLMTAPAMAPAQDDVPPTPADAATPTVEPGTTAGQPLDEPMTLREDVRLTIARAYGFPHWEQVEEIRFTFNVQAPGRDAMSRSWTWKPKEDQVTLHQTEGEDVAYKRRDLQPAVAYPLLEWFEADKQFINDSYWLLFPFQVVWSDPALTDHGRQPLPIGEGSGRKVTVQYPQAGGYTPGDAYDLYLDGDNRIVQWVFRRGGGDEGRPATWEGNRELGPIIVSTEHWGPGEGDGRFHLWFSDLSVKVRADDGESAVHEAEPLQEEP